MLEKDDPLVVLMSPPCAVFSIARATADRMDPVSRTRTEQEALLFVSICAQVVKHRRERGRYIWFEHPFSASSWRLDNVQRLAVLDGVHYVDIDQCELGLSISPGILSKKTLVFSRTVRTCCSPAHVVARGA
eukprot:5204546-Pyramimonas_sp.AAC.1